MSRSMLDKWMEGLPEPDNDDGETGSCKCGNPIYDGDVFCASCHDDFEVLSSRGW